MNDSTDVLGRRIGAALVDLVVLFVLFVLAGILFGDSKAGDDGVGVRLEGGGAMAFFAVTLLYYGVQEALTGQTIGKRLLGVRVVRLDGGRPSTGQIVGRTLLRIIDAVFFYLVALVAILATGQKRQRLGDLAAGTTVRAA